jgi:CysZ protein
MSNQDEGALVPRPESATVPILQHDDERLHPLMRHVLKNREGSTFSRLVAGAKVPFMAARFLMKHRELWTNVLWPVLINLSLFVVLLYVFLTQGGSLFASLWAQPVIEAWYHWLLTGLWYLTYAIVLAASGFLAYVSSMVVGGVLASPFNDILSEKTERILLGEHYRKGEEEPFMQGLLRSAASSAATAALYIACMGPLLLLNIIPGVGSVAYTIIGSTVGGYFLALEYSDTLLARRRYGLGQKMRLVYRERKFSVGFGIGTSLTLAIPLVNFLCIPLAVIGGTAVGLGLEQWDENRALPPGEQEPSAGLLAAENHAEVLPETPLDEPAQASDSGAEHSSREA